MMYHQVERKAVRSSDGVALPDKQFGSLNILSAQQKRKPSQTSFWTELIAILTEFVSHIVAHKRTHRDEPEWCPSARLQVRPALRGPEGIP